MAIQFHCPYCTAVIRVPDSAAGKSGECPKCGSQLLVPKIEIPPQARAAGQDAPHSPPSFDAPTTEPQPPEPSLPVFEPEPAVPNAVPSISRSLRRKRRRRRSGLVFPIVFGTAFVAIVAWFYWKAQTRFTGDLTAVAVDAADLPPKLVDRGYFASVPAASADFVLEGLAKQPQRLTSNVAETELRGSDGGIQVSVHATSATRFYRVDAAADRTLLDYLRENGRALNEPRESELQTASAAFIREWEQAEKEDVAVADPAKYRDALALNALVGSLGHNIEAVCLGRVYPCVYEDDQSRLYFLLPPDIRDFELRGRKLPDGSVLLPAQYTVRVAASAK